MSTDQQQLDTGVSIYTDGTMYLDGASAEIQLNGVNVVPVSGTDDGTNWSTITINGVNKAIPADASSAAANAYNAANSALQIANNASNAANSAALNASNASSLAQDAYNAANNAASVASNAYNAANSAAQSASNAANLAQSAYDAANAASGGGSGIEVLDLSSYSWGDTLSAADLQAALSATLVKLPAWDAYSLPEVWRVKSSDSTAGEEFVEFQPNIYSGDVRGGTDVGNQIYNTADIWMGELEQLGQISAITPETVPSSDGDYVWQVGYDATNFAYTGSWIPTPSGGGGSAPSNMVTTDTAQTITGQKTFSSDIYLSGAEI